MPFRDPQPLPVAKRRYDVREIAVARTGKRGLKRPIICVSHVLPSQPRAGNEYRISRLLEWLASRGHELILVVAPQKARSRMPLSGKSCSKNIRKRWFAVATVRSSCRLAR